MKKAVDVVTKTELKFWIPIIGTIVAMTLAYSSLKGEVEAMQSKGVKLRSEMEEQDKIEEERYQTLIEVRDSVIRMEKDIEYIIKKLQ